MIGAIFSTLMSTPIVRNLLVVAGALFGLFLWHAADKARAVRTSREGMVARAELTAARTQLEELRRRQAVTDVARERLQIQIEEANAEAEAVAEELKHYVSTLDDGCVVRPDLFERLHGR